MVSNRTPRKDFPSARMLYVICGRVEGRRIFGCLFKGAPDCVLDCVASFQHGHNQEQGIILQTLLNASKCGIFK